MTPFSPRIHAALDFAAVHHHEQKRKDADVAIPYVSHLFGVCYILAQYDFEEDVVVAGILHDFLEDIVDKHDRPDLADDMKGQFGDRVHKLVTLVTQQKRDAGGQKLPWHIRGESYRETLLSPTTPDEARAISCADKIHNIESLVMALGRMKGNEQAMWAKLQASPEDQLKKFVSLHAAIGSRWKHPIVDELERKIRILGSAIAG